jgi:hypothetical protein
MSKIGRSYEELWGERSVRIDDKVYDRHRMNRSEGPNYNLRNVAIQGIHTKNLLNQVFFSPQNVANIQKKIRFQVWKQSKGAYTIDDQDETELSVIMRSMYLQYSKNQDDNIREQVQELNNIVIEEIVPELLSRVKSYQIYLKDRSEPWRVFDRQGISTNTAGTKSLEISTALGFRKEDHKFNPFTMSDENYNRVD